MPVTASSPRAKDTASSATAAQGGMSARSAALYLDTSEQMLAKWRYLGEGPPFLKIGRKVIYRLDTLNRWLADQEAETMGSRR